MSRISSILLENTLDNHTVTGDPIRADGSHRFSVAIHTANFTGTLRIEATLLAAPEEKDWFLALPTYTFSANSTAIGETFEGSFTFLRASMRRDGLPENPNAPGQYGSVDRVLLNQ